MDLHDGPDPRDGMDLRGSVALVAGAGPAGAALSLRLAAYGASVAVFDRRPEAVASRIDGAGGHVLALAGDPGDEQAVRAAVGRLLTAWERIDIVVIDAEGLATVAEAVARYLPEAARTSSREVADLVVLGSGTRAEACCQRLRQQLAGQPVRVELVTGDPTPERVLRLIGRRAVAAAGPGGGALDWQPS